ncbi:signal peptidase II [Azospirillum sp. B21]|uniref:signal peptidase II n=1 Tax=unclassified Azospirillum TaxID=2630922 RepID=UPI0011EE85C1|nr:MULTISPECIES: signal peptidase II [unclassified Azospirillum]KAA0576223.1 signal peptidase II [Azospirillum sp. B21]MDR6775599.1 signal peptidase II [Azospirillum sp. BE72]
MTLQSAAPNNTLTGRRRRLGAALLAATFAVALDQGSKWAIIEHVMNPPRLIEVTPFFNLTLGFNRGVSFGLFGDGAVGPWLLSGLALTIVALLLAWAMRSISQSEAAALGAIIGGALGNVIDRVRQGAVTDFLDLHAFGWHWPAFNLADAAIFCGVAMLLLLSWLGKSVEPFQSRP